MRIARATEDFTLVLGPGVRSFLNMMVCMHCVKGLRSVLGCGYEVERVVLDLERVE